MARTGLLLLLLGLSWPKSGAYGGYELCDWDDFECMNRRLEKMREENARREAKRKDRMLYAVPGNMGPLKNQFKGENEESYYSLNEFHFPLPHTPR